MKKAAVLLLLLAVLLISAVFSVSSASQDSGERLRVIVYFKDAPQPQAQPFAAAQNVVTASNAANLPQLAAVSGNKMEVRHEFTSLNGFTADVSPDYYETLKSNPNLKVYEREFLHTHLSDTVNLVNATRVHALNYNDTNITGNTVGVCVLDTGVNYGHSALGGCSDADFDAGACGKVPSGFDYVNNDNRPLDDNGHGSHVAGIISSTDSTYPGVAPNASILAIKVCDSAGDCGSDLLASGIDWCISNATTFNISIISMSIGTVALYSSYCDSAYLSWTEPIDIATISNISVVVSAGNSGSTTGISSPACIKNVTAVSSTTKSDGFSAYNRNNVTDLLAPGSSITSVDHDGTFTAISGTSMAAPHVSGAYALVTQYMKVERNQTVNETFLLHALNSTGVALTDSGGSGLTFYRISIYDAITALDETPPNLTFVAPTPENGSLGDNSSIFINITSTEVLVVASLEWSNGSVANYSMNGSGLNWFLNFSTLALGAATYRVFANDSAGNVGVTEARSLIFSAPGPNLSVMVPVAGANISGDFLVNASVNSSNSVASVNLTLYNSSGNATGFLLMSIGSGSSWQGYWNATIEVSSLPEGSYNISVNATDDGGNVTLSENVSVVLDSTAPNASVDVPLDSSAITGEFLINASVNDTTSGVLNASFRIINPLTATGWLYAELSSGTTASGYWNASFDSSSLPIGTYNITINATDFAGNQNISNVSQVELNSTFTGLNSCQALGSSNATYRLLQAVSAAGTCFTITAYNVTLDCDAYAIEYGASGSGYGVNVESVNGTRIRNCIIAKSGSAGSGNYGVYIAISNNTVIENNTITTNGTGYNYGVFLNTSRQANITNNNITANGDSGYNIAVYLKNSGENNLTSNILSANGTLNNYGVLAEISSGNVIRDNVITTDGNSTDNYGVYLFNSSEGNVVISNNITSNGTSLSYGIYLSNSNLNNLTGNIVTTAANISSGIVVEGSNFSIIVNNTIKTTGNFSFAVSLANLGDNVPQNNSIYNNVFNSTDRHVNITSSLQVNNFSVEVASITNIIGDSKVGGNYYDNSTVGGESAYSLSCADADRDGICDASLAHAGNNTDFYPLKIVAPAPPETPTSVTGSSGGGGGGGGGSATTAADGFAQAKVWDVVSAASPAVFEVRNAQIPVTSVVFGLSENAERVEVVVAKVSGKPSEVKALYAGRVHSYITITKSNVNDASVYYSTISFRVERGWLASNNALASNIVLLRYGEGWAELDTVITGFDEVHYYYEAESPGLSVFAIALRPEPSLPLAETNVSVANVTGQANVSVEEAVAEVEVEAPAPDFGKLYFWLFAAVSAFVLLFIGNAVRKAHKRRRHHSKHGGK